MKTALLLSGLIPKNFDKYYNSIYKTLIQPFNSDVFISTWQSQYNDDVFILYKPKLMRSEDFDSVPVKFRLNEFLKFLYDINYTGNKSIVINSLYPMYYKLYDTYNLMKEYENFNNIKYDLIIRCRFDLSFLHKHPSCIKGPFLFEKIDENEIKDSIDNNILYLRLDGGGDFVWDQFAFGSSYVIENYCKTFLNLKKLIKPNFYPNETLLYWNLNNNEIKLKHTSTVYDIKTYDEF